MGVPTALGLLEAEGAIASFKTKLLREQQTGVDSWRTELWFAAWLKRNGVAIAFEPPVGERCCEFVARTEPETWWEIKTLQDLEPLRLEDAVQNDVQRRLRRLSEPYVLVLFEFDLPLADVAKAVKAIRQQITAFHVAQGALPHRFEAHGLVIDATARSNHGHGYLGLLQKEHMFQNEHAARVAARIHSSTRQIPPNAAGVIVIDDSASDWLEQEYVVDACYGELVGTHKDGDGRYPGEFRPDSGRRISAVVSYSRRWVRDFRNFEMRFLHNPYAHVPLPPGLFAYGGVRHTRRVDVEGRYRLETVGD